MIKTMKQKIGRLLILVRVPCLVVSEPTSPGKVGNHYCHGNGHGQLFRLLRFFQNPSSTPFASGASNRGTISSYVSVGCAGRSESRKFLSGVQKKFPLRESRLVPDGWSMSSIKRDVKKKVPPRPESRFVSRDPAHCSFGSLGEVGPFVHTHRFSADRGVLSSLRERQASVVECVNHGSIRGSWPMTISGYPRGHNV